MKFEVGKIIRWNNFSLQRHPGKRKPRWFICLGFSGPFAQVATVYLSTTTAQVDHFKKDGSRSNHKHLPFEADKTPFENDCVIDFHEQPYSISEEKIDDCSSDIEFKGDLEKKALISIYTGYLESNSVSPKVMSDIHNSFNMAGITGLKMPTSRKRRK